MEETPWSRPSMDDLKHVLESFGNTDAVNVRCGPPGAVRSRRSKDIAR
jgi:hypothetical protein